MKKWCLLLLLFIATVLYANDTKLVIKDRQNSETIFNLSTNPIISYENEEMVIANDLTHISIPLENVDYFYFTDESLGINDIVVDNTHYQKGHIILSGLPIGIPVIVYSIDGRIIDKKETIGTEKVDINLDMISRGTFIIRVGNKTYKIINK